MHLLALLIAAVFSSEFTAPNAILTIEGVTPALKGLDLLLGLPALEISVTGTAAGALTWTLEDAIAGGEPADISEDVSPGAALKYTTPKGLDVSVIVDPARTFPVNVNLTVEEAAESNSVAPITLPVTPIPAFTVNGGAAIEFTDATKMPQLTFECNDKSHWHGAMKALIKVSTKPDVLIPIVKAGETGQETYKTAGGEDITGLGITWTNIGTTVLTIELVLREEATLPEPVTEVVHPTKLTPTIRRAPFVEFNVLPATLLPADNVTTKAFTVAPVTDVTWAPTDTIKALLTKTATAVTNPELVTIAVTAPVSGATRWTFTADVQALSLAETDTKVYVWISRANVVLTLPFVVNFDGVAEPIGEFTIDPPSFTYAQMTGKATPLTFAAVDLDDDPTPTTWDETVKVRFSYGDEDVEVDVAGTGTPKVYTLASVNLDALNIPIEGGEVTVELAPHPVVDNIKYLPESVPLTIAPKLAVFSINIEEIQQSAIAAVAFSLTPIGTDEIAAWKATGTTVYATFTPTDAIPTVVGDYDFDLTPPASGATAFTGTADLTGFNFAGLTDNKIYVWAMLDDGDDQEWRDVPKTVTFVPSTDPVFTLNITGIKEEDMKTIAVEVTPDPLTAFDEEVIKIGFTTTETPVTTDPAAILTVEQDEADDKWKASGDISALTVTAQTTNVYAWIKIGDAWLAHKVTLPFTAAPVADFTVTPTTIDLRTDPTKTITVEQKVQTTAWTEKVFLYFTLTKGTPTSTTLKKEATPAVVATKDQYSVADFTLSEITGIDKDKTVYVYVEHGATAGLDGTLLDDPATISITKSDEPAEPEAAMGVSPLLSLLAALVFLFVKLF